MESATGDTLFLVGRGAGGWASECVTSRLLVLVVEFCRCLFCLFCLFLCLFVCLFVCL